MNTKVFEVVFMNEERWVETHGFIRNYRIETICGTAMVSYNDHQPGGHPVWMGSPDAIRIAQEFLK